MKYIADRARKGEILAGAWLNLGSNLTAEIASRVGFDWVLIDMEHGSGSDSNLVSQLQAVDQAGAVSIVRIAWNEAPRFKRVLDLGAAGVMVPYVNTAEEARLAVAAMRYPPAGTRGAAKFHRAAGFSLDFDSYFENANQNLLTIVQIETVEAVKNVEEIAAVDGVDVLFVGPLDLSVSLGIPGQTGHPAFREAIKKVIDASRNAGKVSGTLLVGADQIPQAIEDGYTFLAASSDGAMVASGMKSLRQSFRNCAAS